MDPLPTNAGIILDSLNEGVFTVDLDWRITSFNAAAEAITGVPRTEAVGSPCCEVFRADVCETDCVLRRTIDSGEPVVGERVHITDPDGHRLPIRVSTALLQDNDGQVVGGVESFQDCSQLEELRKRLEADYTCEDLIGRSPAMQEIFSLLPRIATSDSTVLVSGASGTGKELAARALHKLSYRADGPFVAVNCAALPESLLESELFGHKAGAFTGAVADRAGRFAQAHGGTIFLDEIGDITPATQVRLLRVLQERMVEPLGGQASEAIDVRVITATNKDLTVERDAGHFREDLYYRLRVVELHMPALCERREDIPLLVDHFVARLNHLQDRRIIGVDEAVLDRLLTHNFPGNVRELENILEHAFVLCHGDLIRPEHLPPELRPAPDEPSGSVPTTDLAELERRAIRQALARHRGNRRRAATDLGINVNTLYRKIKDYGIDPPPRDGRGERRTAR